MAKQGSAKERGPRVGLYPGTFDPVTIGHLDVIRRSMRLVDQLVIGVAINRDKGPLFSLEERVALLEQEVGRIAESEGGAITVQPFETLLVSFAEEVGAHMIIRGLRAVADFEYEFQMVGMNRAMNEEIEMVFLMADPNHQAIASRLVKEIARLKGDISKFVTPNVREQLKAKFRGSS